MWRDSRVFHRFSDVFLVCAWLVIHGRLLSLLRDLVVYFASLLFGEYVGFIVESNYVVGFSGFVFEEVVVGC